MAVANFDNNKKACYDQVIAELASLAAISHYQYPLLTQINTNILKQAQYYI